MEDSQIRIPVTVGFYREVQRDLAEKFHPFMDELQKSLDRSKGSIRDELLAQGCIECLDIPEFDEPVLGVDAGVAYNDYGEISTAIAVGVVSSTTADVAPGYFFDAIYGTSSETFNKVSGYLRIAQELEALSHAQESGKWVLYDGSFLSANFEICKFAASMPNNLDGAAIDADFIEWELVLDAYRRCLYSKHSSWFCCFGGMNCGKRLISVSKRGIGKYWSKRLESFARIVDSAYMPSDKMVLSLALQPGESTKPVSYEDVFSSSSHGSKVSGYGTPSTGSGTFKTQHAAVERTFKGMRIISFKPYPWSPILTVHYNSSEHSKKDILAVVKSTMKTRSVMEPMPLYLADLLSKQASSAIKLYGPVNMKRYPSLFKAFRTSKR